MRTTARPTSVQYSVIGSPAENVNGLPVGMVEIAPTGNASASANVNASASANVNANSGGDNMHYTSLPSEAAAAPPPKYMPGSSNDANQGL